ncbi:MAG: hypothetical protein AVDCRST_MAG30-4352, partial [uncultured Solirubrobacteraceae bacterium]
RLLGARRRQHRHLVRLHRRLPAPRLRLPQLQGARPLRQGEGAGRPALLHRHARPLRDAVGLPAPELRGMGAAVLRGRGGVRM